MKNLKNEGGKVQPSSRPDGGMTPNPAPKSARVNNFSKIQPDSKPQNLKSQISNTAISKQATRASQNLNLNNIYYNTHSKLNKGKAVPTNRSKWDKIVGKGRANKNQNLKETRPSNQAQNVNQFKVVNLNGDEHDMEMRDNHFKETKKQDNFTVISHENIYGEDPTFLKYANLMPLYMDLYYSHLSLKSPGQTLKKDEFHMQDFMLFADH